MTNQSKHTPGSAVAAPSAGTPPRDFPICEDHRNADWNRPSLDDYSCILCRLFYLEAQESLLEEWQQRAKRAEDAISEIERPLDAQMARLNATVERLNVENGRLERELADKEDALSEAGDRILDWRKRALKAEAAQSAIGDSALLPGLHKALELSDQCRAYFEMSARPLSADHEWFVRVKLASEIERIERSVVPIGGKSDG